MLRLHDRIGDSASSPAGAASSAVVSPVAPRFWRVSGIWPASGYS